MQIKQNSKVEKQQMSKGTYHTKKDSKGKVCQSSYENFEEYKHRVRGLQFMKVLHQDGKEIIISDAHNKVLEIDDYIARAIIADYEDCDVPSDFKFVDWTKTDPSAQSSGQITKKLAESSKIKLDKFIKKMASIKVVDRDFESSMLTMSQRDFTDCVGVPNG